MGIYDEHKPEIGSGKYFKPEEGKTYNIVIASDPVIFDNVFEGPVETQISTKYAWKIYNRTDKVAQVMQLPGGGFVSLSNIAKNPKWGSPLAGKYDIDYVKTGTGKDTKHSLIPVPSDGKLTPEEARAVEDIDLVESIKAGKGSQRVQLVSDVIENGRTDGGHEAAATTAQHSAPEEDIPDEPINLDDIPF